MYSSSQLKRSWIEIDLGQLEKNYNLYRSALPQDTKVIAVVKADAYGHGDVTVCRKLHELGVDYFAVSNIDEAKGLRSSGISGEILILGYTPVEYAEEMVRLNITQALLSEDYAEALAQTGAGVKCQFAVDTGMNRIGIDGGDPALCENIIRKYSKKLDINGAFTHLCVADSDIEENVAFTRGQLDKFKAVIERISDLSLPYIHSLNSAGGLYYAEKGDTVRLGIVLYGLKPDYSNIVPEGIMPCLTWKSAVAMVKKVKAGDSIGYGRAFTAEREMTVATLPTGYADGYRREMSNRGYVIIHGRKAPIVGRVCMDQMMVDVSGIENVKQDDAAILLGHEEHESFNADDMAELIGTIGYEIICGISKRVPRIYI